MVIRGVIEDGTIRPLDPIPPEWQNGHHVSIEEADDPPFPSDEELDRWEEECNRLASLIDQADWDRMKAAIDEHRAEAKAWMRREMGLS